LRNKFLQMTSPQEFWQERKENATIISHNVPPMLARADAAFAVLSEALKKNPAPEERTDFYGNLFIIADEAAALANDANQLTHADGITADFSTLTDSLQFIYRNLGVICSIADAREDSEDTTGFYVGLEEQTLVFLRNGMENIRTRFARDRKVFLKTLSKADMDRFARAHTEFLTHYQNIADGILS
ncbi:MAG: hypothetical protein J6Q65_04490, partial [Lentisphaeria bacterium]|nr:hypothetical protein [Lentisphaeria bacterium]